MVAQLLPECSCSAITTQTAPPPQCWWRMPRLNRSGGSESFTLLSRVILNWVRRWRCTCCETYVAAELKGAAGWMRNVTVPSHEEQPPEDNLGCLRKCVEKAAASPLGVPGFNSLGATLFRRGHRKNTSFVPCIQRVSVRHWFLSHLSPQWCSDAVMLFVCSLPVVKSNIGTLRFSSSVTRACTFALLSLFLHSTLPSAYHRFSFFLHVSFPPLLLCTLEIGMHVPSVQGLGVGSLLRNTRASITR